jgi:hypothetical protein
MKLKVPNSLVIAAFTMLLLRDTNAAVILTDWTSFSAGNLGNNFIGAAAGTLALPTSTATVTFASNVYVGGCTTASTITNSTEFSSTAAIGSLAIPLSEIITDDGNVTAVNTNTISFSQPVLNPIMYLATLGKPNIPIDWVFTSSFNILSTAVIFGGAQPLINPSGNILRGAESYGVIQFSGLVSQIKLNTSTFENTAGFQIGYTIPESSTSIIAVLTGSLALLRRRLN